MKPKFVFAPKTLARNWFCKVDKVSAAENLSKASCNFFCLLAKQVLGKSSCPLLIELGYTGLGTDIAGPNYWGSQLCSIQIAPKYTWMRSRDPKLLTNNTPKFLVG